MHWTSLYLSSDDTQRILIRLQTSLTSHGYELFDPFGLIPGKTFPQAVRLFVAPPANGWTRILGALDDFIPLALSSLGVCLLVGLEAETSRIQTFVNGMEVDPIEALTPHLRPERADDLRDALSSGGRGTARRVPTPIPLDALPPDVQNMAHHLNPNQMNRMFNKLMGRLGKGMADDVLAARHLLENAPKWGSAGGQRILAVMDCLTIPNWQRPDFITLRDAYQLHVRRQRSPNAALYPGDAEAMEAVPDALRYTPIYGGKS